jgi:acyl transferase domain-containing protein
MLATDGRCKTLDAAADGYVRAEAAGVLLLQLGAVAGAVAVIRSTAVNQDGRSSSLTAPNGPAQQDVLRAALAAAGAAAEDVAGISMHGTGGAAGWRAGNATPCLDQVLCCTVLFCVVPRVACMWPQVNAR